MSRLLRSKDTTLDFTLETGCSITNAGKNVGKKAYLYTVGGNVNYCSHRGKQYGDSLKN
jgi:hypothetical protein